MSINKKKWIKDALSGGKNKGALRRTALRMGLLRNEKDTLSMTDLKKLQKVGGKTSKRAYLAQTLMKFDIGGSIDFDYELRIQPDFKYKNIAKRWLDDNPKDSIIYKLAVLILIGVKDPDKKLNLDYNRYARLLRRLDSIISSKHEGQWRIDNYTLYEAEKWVRESLGEIFYLYADNKGQYHYSKEWLDNTFDEGGNIWTKEQSNKVYELNADFEKSLKEKGINRNSKEASYFWEIGGFRDRMADIFGKKYDNRGNIMQETLSISEVEELIGRKINLWKDDEVIINGSIFKKCFLKPYYKLNL